MSDDSRAPAPRDSGERGFRRGLCFEPANLLREARRKKGFQSRGVPDICNLDPDGDILRGLRRAGQVHHSSGWACYHTDLYEFEHGPARFGIIGCAVGASFAVLLAQELFAYGCRFLMHDIRRPDQTAWTATLFRADRTGAARRGHQLSLPTAGRIRRGRPCPDQERARGSRGLGGSGLSRRRLDNRRGAWASAPVLPTRPGTCWPPATDRCVSLTRTAQPCRILS